MSDFGLIENKASEMEQLIGTPSVDIAEISSQFMGAYEAVGIVNSFDSGLLKNIAYVYNEHNEKAFGVFNPKLNETINWIRVKKELENKGFKTFVENEQSDDSALFAMSPKMPKEKINEVMNGIFKEKSQTGGVAIGINSSEINMAADKINGDPNNSKLSNEQKEQVKTCILASVIAHEATHALGHKDEAVPEQVQAKVMDFAIKRFNLPLVSSNQVIHASPKNSWYKKSQFGGGASAIVPFKRNVAIEPVLRSIFEAERPLFNINIEPNDSLETALIKNEHNKEQKKTEKVSLEKSLAKQHTGDKFLSMEGLLEQNKAHPLIVPLASFNGQIKVAGWGSNLGGNFIGGPFQYLSGIYNDGAFIEPFSSEEIKDKVITDENSGSSYWTNRYNPLFRGGEMTTDRMGHLSFEYDTQVNLADAEFRNRPQLWEDRDSYWPNRPDIAVASSKGSLYSTKSDVEKNDVIQIVKKIGYFKNLVKSGKRKAIRMIVAKDCLSYIEQGLEDSSYVIFKGKNDNDYVVWINGSTSVSEIKEIESNIVEKKNLHVVNKFVGLDVTIKEKINKIMSKCKFLSQEHGLKDVYAVGGFVRTLASNKNFFEVNDLDFSATHYEDSLKLGGLLAADLGIYDVGYCHRSKTMSFKYDGIKMDFRGQFIPFDVRPFMRDKGIETTPLNFDIYGRDFTVNSLIYSFMNNHIFDVCGRGLNDLKNKELVTFFDPNLIIPLNPIIITRAILLNLKGFKITDGLDSAIKKHSQSLFNGSVSDVRLSYEYEKISKHGEDGEILLKDYNLLRLKNIREETKIKNPNLFSEK